MSKQEEFQHNFDDLNALRQDLLLVKSRQPTALALFYDKTSGGFRSIQTRPPGHLSPSSTATCVTSLIVSRQWPSTQWSGESADLVARLLRSKWETKGLNVGNVYTVSFILEAVHYLWNSLPAGPRPANASLKKLIAKAETILAAGLSKGHATIATYPPSAYLTQLAVRVLRLRAKLDSGMGERVDQWAAQELGRQLAMILARSKTADFFQLAYCAILLANFDEPGQASPDRKLLIDSALEQLFLAQLPDGTWPRSAPLFDLPGVGSAYCYEYEMLAQLLREKNLEDRLLRHLPKIQLAFQGLLDSAYTLDNGAQAWSSGHRPQFRGPESWATASGYHFVHAFERLVSEAIRRAVFRYARVPYSRPSFPKDKYEEFAKDLLDSQIQPPDEAKRSLKRTLYELLVNPVATQSQQVADGATMARGTPTTAILFGPPGTSKTQMSKQVSEYLGWPLLALDPSHFARFGIDQVSTEADKLFRMLAALERVVVLVDEIDELVRERSGSAEAQSRFLTTSMLPKLAALHASRRIVFLVATNHIEQFDVAISRPGRFDLIMQVLPPTAEEKLKKWPALGRVFGRTFVDDAARHHSLEELTYDETDRLVRKVSALSKKNALDTLDGDFKNCTLSTQTDRLKADSKTWAKASEEQRSRIQLHAP